MPKVFVQ